MGNVHSEIKKRLREICGRELLMWVATVQEVSGDVCAVTIDGTRFTGVRLCAVSDASSTKLVVRPKRGSKVIVADLSAGRLTDLMVVKCSEVDSITINGGELGGLVKIKELHNRLNALETAFNSHTHTLFPMVAGTYPVNGGSMVDGVVVPGQTGTKEPTSRSNEFQSDYRGYEDGKITH